MKTMHKSDHYEALRVRGHDPSMIIFSEPARRESIKGEIQFSSPINNCPVDNTKSSSRYQKLPLRMLISQTAYRDPETRFQEKKQLNFPSKSQDDILSVSAKIMQRDTYPYSQYSRHTKHDVVSSSIKMWLKNSYARNSSKTSQTTGFTEDTANSELDVFPRNSSIACNKSEEKNLFLEDEILKTEDMKKNDITGLEEFSQTQFGSDDHKDVFDRLTIETDKFESNLFDNHNSDYQNNAEFNDRFYLSRKENSQILPSKYPFASKTDSIEFIWDPVSSQSLNEINFDCTIDFQEENLNVSHEFSMSSNSYLNEYCVSDHLEFFNSNNSFTSFENVSEK